jgi:hypothetical protein
MNIFEHCYNAKDILDTYPIYDDGDTCTISYEYNNKSFTINMKYFWGTDRRFYGFVNFFEQQNNLDEDSSYLVGYILERYINHISNTEYPPITVVFYTADNMPEYHKLATLGFNHIWFFNTRTNIKSNKYNFYIVSCFNNLQTSWDDKQLIHFLDNEI